MRIGVPTELKESERRVALLPAGVRELVAAGHEVLVETGAGSSSGFADERYAAEGAELIEGPFRLFERAELIVKVKEPVPAEIDRLGQQHVLFAYLHLAADAEMARRLASSGATCIAYETVTDAAGRLPLLAPMSEIAGRLATQLGASYLLASDGGNGTLLGGVPGIPPARVTIVGGGVVGRHAAAVAIGLGAQVTILDRSLERLRELDSTFGPAPLMTAFSTDSSLEEALAGADLVIGAVLLPGARAPRVVRRSHLPLLAADGVIVDVSIDQGGCVETSIPTTHANPIRTVDGVRHAAITNLPAAAARTATRALTNATLPYIRRLADLGTTAALELDSSLRAGLAAQHGELVAPGASGAE